VCQAVRLECRRGPGRARSRSRSRSGSGSGGSGRHIMSILLLIALINNACYSMQVTLSHGRLPRLSHSLTIQPKVTLVDSADWDGSNSNTDADFMPHHDSSIFTADMPLHVSGVTRIEDTSTEAAGTVDDNMPKFKETSSSSSSSSSSSAPRVIAERRPWGPGKEGLHVSRKTRIMSEEEFRATDPNDRHRYNIWTPGDLLPGADVDVDRAVAVAESTFIIVEAALGGTTMSVYSLDATYRGDLNKKSKRSIKLSDQAKSIQLGKHGDTWLGNRCTGVNKQVGSVVSDFNSLAQFGREDERDEATMSIITALYATCKKNINRALHGEFDDTELRLLEGLHPRNGSTSLSRLIDTWFNNVDIYFEGTGSIRLLDIDLSFVGSSVEESVMDVVRSTDMRVRHNKGHFYGRVLPGTWQAYYQYLSTLRWVRSNKVLADRFTADNTLAIGLGPVSVQLAWRMGASRVTLPGGSMHNAVKVEQSDDNDDEQSFLQVSGPMSLFYPISNNPGQVMAKSYLGLGSVRILTKLLHLVAVKNQDAEVGAELDMPCLSKGMILEQRSVADPMLSYAQTVCWGSRRASGALFDSSVCQQFSTSRAVVRATALRKQKFVGSSDYFQCKLLLREALQGVDDHKFPVAFNPQFERLVNSSDAPLNTAIRERLSNIVINEPDMAEYLKAAEGNVPGVPANASTKGMTNAQFILFAQALAGEQFGSRGVDNLGPYDYDLPLSGVLMEVLLLEKLRFFKWPGKVFIADSPWQLGLEDVVASMTYTHDRRYKKLYETFKFTAQQRVGAGTDSNDDEVADNLVRNPSSIAESVLENALSDNESAASDSES
jgi:hypothetical protein